jgi:hypothetical protein
MPLSVARANHFCNYSLELSRRYPPGKAVCRVVRVEDCARWSSSLSGGDR